MTTNPRPRKLATSGLLIVALGMFGAAGSGCAYGGVASTADGTVIIARNGLLGAMRRVYVCKLAGEDLKCTEANGAP